MYALRTDRSSPLKRAARVLAAGVLGGGIVTALGLGWHHVAEDPAFRVEHLEISGNHRASTPQLRHLADVPVHQHLAAVDLDRVRAGVMRHPWVEAATVRRTYPGGLEIQVQEHEPALLLAAGRLWYLDADGRPIKQAESGDLDYPVLTGLDPVLADARPDLAGAVIQGALRVWRACDGDPIAPELVSEIHHDPLTGYELVLDSGTRLVLGTGSPQPALDRLRRMIRVGLDLSVPQRIDLDIETVAVATPLPSIPPGP